MAPLRPGSIRPIDFSFAAESVPHRNCGVPVKRFSARMMCASSDTTPMGVVITAADGDAASCVNEAVSSNRGGARDVLGQQSVLATLKRRGIEDVAARADVQFDDSPPPVSANRLRSGKSRSALLSEVVVSGDGSVRS
jgi:hypothetical protein